MCCVFLYLLWKLYYGLDVILLRLLVQDHSGNPLFNTHNSTGVCEPMRLHVSHVCYTRNRLFGSIKELSDKRTYGLLLLILLTVLIARLDCDTRLNLSYCEVRSVIDLTYLPTTVVVAVVIYRQRMLAFHPSLQSWLVSALYSRGSSTARQGE